MRKPRIGLVGYFGYQNLGDEMFVWTWKQAFGDRADVRVLHPWEDPKKFDGIIVGGGDLILPDFVNDHFWRDEIINGDVPYWVYGVGVYYSEWTDEAAAKYRDVFNNSRGFWVRDTNSRDRLVDGVGLPKDGVGVVEDLAWAYDIPETLIRKSDEDKWLGVSMRPEPDIMPALQGFHDAIAHVWRTMGMRTILIPLQPTDVAGLSDRLVNRILMAVVSDTNRPSFITCVPPDMYLEQRLGVIAKCSKYLTTRFHGFIMGLRMGVPTVVFTKSHTHMTKFTSLAPRVSPHSLVFDVDDIALRVACAGMHDMDIVRGLEISAKKSVIRFVDTVLSEVGRRVTSRAPLQSGKRFWPHCGSTFKEGGIGHAAQVSEQ